MKYQTIKIKKITKLNNYNSDRYDIEVKNNHNYFANNILVHNCRTLFDGQTFKSRKGKVFGTLDHLKDEAQNLIKTIISICNRHPILDGELYSDELEFQQIISAIKRDDPNDLTPQIQYHIYDIAVPELTYSNRLSILNEAFDACKPKSLINVKTHKIQSKSEIHQYHAQYVGNGKEGVMLRNVNGIYTPDKRSYDLQKVKQFDDAEFEIVNYKIDKNGHAVFTCVTEQGCEFDVKPKGEDDVRTYYTENADNIIGELMTVKYFGLTTGDNPVPRFPIGVCIRNFE